MVPKERHPLAAKHTWVTVVKHFGYCAIGRGRRHGVRSSKDYITAFGRQAFWQQSWRWCWRRRSLASTMRRPPFTEEKNTKTKLPPLPRSHPYSTHQSKHLAAAVFGNILAKKNCLGGTTRKPSHPRIRRAESSTAFSSSTEHRSPQKIATAIVKKDGSELQTTEATQKVSALRRRPFCTYMTDGKSCRRAGGDGASVLKVFAAIRRWSPQRAIGGSSLDHDGGQNIDGARLKY